MDVGEQIDDYASHFGKQGLGRPRFFRGWVFHDWRGCLIPKARSSSSFTLVAWFISLAKCGASEVVGLGMVRALPAVLTAGGFPHEWLPPGVICLIFLIPFFFCIFYLLPGLHFIPNAR